LKKIAILAFSNKNAGGVYQYTQSIIDALKKDKTHTYVICCYTSDNRFDNLNLEIRKIEKPKIDLYKKIIRAFQCLFFIRKSFFFTKKELDAFSDIDVFISPEISTYPHFYMNKPFVFTLHDMQERHYPGFFSIYQKSTRWLNNTTLAKSATKIICESSFVKNDIIKFTGVDADKINIIQSPPPENFLHYKLEDNQFQTIKEKYNLPEKFIFYPAQCWLHKNHIKLVEAFQIISNKNDNVYLILTGSRKNNYNNLMQRIDELGLNERVRHLGYIDYEDLPYFYKLSQFLIMPTLFESVSIPIYEAFALKVAVCSSNVVALPEQVGNAGLLFDPNNIYDIALKIDLYLKNKELQKRKAALGYVKVKSFNHEEYKEKLLKAIL
jgi:glycosyltransferase involved in cell wall biosynthesis